MVPVVKSVLSLSVVCLQNSNKAKGCDSVAEHVKLVCLCTISWPADVHERLFKQPLIPGY